MAPLSSSTAYGLFPAPLRSAYGFDGISGTGAGQTIAIVDAFNTPYFVNSSDTANYNNSDLAKFNAAFGLTQFGGSGPTFTKIDQTGGTNYPADSTVWAPEITLDVEWAHVIAPQANIILIEANNDANGNLFAGVAYARDFTPATVISMSFGGSEDSTGPDTSSTYFTQPGDRGVAYFAASGDSGAPGLFPATSSSVVAVGATILTQNNGAYVSESGWSGSGGGISTAFAKPTYQSGVMQSSSFRTIPDVAFNGGPGSAVAVYDSLTNGVATPWTAEYGTSLACPLFAATISIADQQRANAGLGSFSTTYIPGGDNSAILQTKLYLLTSNDFNDITSGNNGYAAGTGYDLVTGLGTPKVNLFLGDIIGTTVGRPTLTAASDSGVSNADGITNVTRPTFTGAVSGSGTIRILVDGVVSGSAAASNGTYTITLTSALTDGQHTITATMGTALSDSSRVVEDTLAPTLSSTTFVYTVATHRISLTFSEAISPIDLSHITITNTTTNTVVPSGYETFFSSMPSRISIFFPGFTNGTLPNGRYSLAISNGMTDLAGNALGTASASFFFLLGDANHDGSVNIADLGALATNYGHSGPFASGDFNYDGMINIADLGILATYYGVSLPLSSSVAVQSFSQRPIATGPSPTAGSVTLAAAHRRIADLLL